MQQTLLGEISSIKEAEEAVRREQVREARSKAEETKKHSREAAARERAAE
jgi:hypothetical protein